MNSRSLARTCITLGVALLNVAIGLANSATAQIVYRTVALSGQAAPGTLPGVHYSFIFPPALNDAGQAAYLADLAGSGVGGPDHRTIYAGPLAAPQLVARRGDAAPGTPAGVNYYILGTPVLNNAGQAAYRTSLVGIGVTFENDRAIYAGPLAAPQLVARTGDAAPGTPAGVNYSDSIFSPELNDAGQVAYLADLAGSNVTGANNEAIFAGPLAAPQLVARTGDAAPGTPAGVNYSDIIFSPALNDAGQVAYLADLAGSGVTSMNASALYAGPLSAPQIVARAGDVAPGTSAGVNYSGFAHDFEYAPALNDAGQVEYFAFLSGNGVTSANDSAIYAGPLAAPQLVAREGDAAPGMPAGVNYSGFGPPGLNDAGQVAYYALLSGGGVTSGNDFALYAGPLAAPQLVARKGDPAPGTPAGVNYALLSPYSTPAHNIAGQTAYFASLTGSGVMTANDRGLFLSDPTHGGLLIAREGDLFDVGDGDLRTIVNGGIGFTSDDEPTGLSNDGTLVFSLGFTDGTRGIFTAKITSGPSADFDGDHDVDGQDLAQWRGDYAVNALSDADHDGDSDGADFLVWQRQLGAGGPGAVAIPEPATLSLLAGALMLVSCRSALGRRPIFTPVAGRRAGRHTKGFNY